MKTTVALLCALAALAVATPAAHAATDPYTSGVNTSPATATSQAVADAIAASGDTSSSAAYKAQVHVQNPECGRGTTWVCESKYFPMRQHCFWNYGPAGPGNGWWDCKGVYTDWRLPLFTEHYGTVYVHLHHGYIFFWHDLLLGIYGSSAVA